MLSAAVQAAFGQRRKMLRQSLKGFAVSRGMDIAKLLAAADIDPTSRAEDVEIAGFVRLARAAAQARREPSAGGADAQV
jgi:16S rRNA (adenine1518-N6/adenine1519-N6)-dimethyltransferase